MERRKKIIFTVTNGLSFDQRMHRICKTLSQAFEVELIGRVLGEFNTEQHADYTCTRLKCKFNKGILFYLEYNLRLFLYLIQQKADIYCAIDSDTILACGLIAKIKQKAFYFDAHEYFTEVPELINRPFQQYIWSQVNFALIPRADVAYTVGNILADVLHARYDIPFATVRNVPWKSMQPVINNNCPTQAKVLYQGVLNEGRGLEEVIESMQYWEGELWLAGTGDIIEKLKTLVTTKKLRSRVKFLGAIHPTQLKSITLDADICLNLLEAKSLNYYYSLANKFFDAIQAGKPCICADFPEYQHLNSIYQTALLCELNPISIAEKINQLIHNPSLYLHIQEQCKLAAKDWCWENESSKLKALYHV